MIDEGEEGLERAVPEINDFWDRVVLEQRIDQSHLALDRADIRDNGLVGKAAGKIWLMRVGVEAAKCAAARQKVIAEAQATIEREIPRCDRAPPRGISSSDS